MSSRGRLQFFDMPRGPEIIHDFTQLRVKKVNRFRKDTIVTTTSSIARRITAEQDFPQIIVAINRSVTLSRPLLLHGLRRRVKESRITGEIELAQIDTTHAKTEEVYKFRRLDIVEEPMQGRYATIGRRYRNDSGEMVRNLHIY